MDLRNNFVYYIDSPTQPQRRTFTDTDAASSPFRARQDAFWGGEPMEATNSNGSTNSNMSHGSYISATTASSPNTAYGSYETNNFATNFHQISSVPVESLYTTNAFDNGLHQMRIKTEAQGIENISSTPSTLGWTPNTELLKIYRCVVPKDRKPPFLELRSGYLIQDLTPFRVQLDKPINYPKGQYPCMYPGCGTKKELRQEDGEKKKGSKKKNSRKQGSKNQADKDQGSQEPEGPPVFNRPADLERHYIAVHSDDKPKYPCDYPKCSRAQTPFNRKDHHRDHLRDFHREDLGSAKRGKKHDGISEEEIEANWQRDQQQWLLSRLISKKSWRCNKCLTKNVVANHGWTCQNQNCNQLCEEERRQARQKLFSEAVPLEGPASLGTTTTPNYCFQCNNSGSVYSEFLADWEPCAHCQVSSGPSLYATDECDYDMEL